VFCLQREHPTKINKKEAQAVFAGRQAVQGQGCELVTLSSGLPLSWKQDLEHRRHFPIQGCSYFSPMCCTVLHLPWLSRQRSALPPAQADIQAWTARAATCVHHSSSA
jgi:hypothetical protein